MVTNLVKRFSFDLRIGTLSIQITIMTIKEYQDAARVTLIDSPDFQIKDKEVMISWFALGLTGEAGEVADLVKKGIYHQQGIDMDKIKRELGDVLWYLSALADHLNITFEDIMQTNVDKLKARFPKGYEPDRTTFREGMAK